MKLAVLDNLRSVYNVGSIFRTANAGGIDKLYLCGTTPTPLDAKGRKRSDFAKVALGAEDAVAWEYITSTQECLAKLKQDGAYLIAIEQDECAEDYKSISIAEKDDVAFVIGPEVEGMNKETIDMCDVVAEIPMAGTKESLNVTIAFGIAIYRILGL
jgi:23S rRNA (guanosine2251-2'-O)-methyltransferase